MRVVDIITKKRLGLPLENSELTFLLTQYLDNQMPDYQMSAFLMAVVFQGLDERELLCLTQTMANSGDIVRFKKPHRKFIIDKHSTGGVGDKTTISLAPLIAAKNLAVAKLTGRGLGHTGGTIDKFESIAGFAFKTKMQDMETLLNNTGIGLMGGTDTLVPLDKKLYALRDVNSTVHSIPLIASSIMSKKLAVHSDAIILDVKVGNGAFMQHIEEAKSLATAMHRIGKNDGRKIACIVTDMNQPLGQAVGNSLEFIEAVETLKGNGPKDFTELVLQLAALSIVQQDENINIKEGYALASELIGTPAPLNQLARFIEESGGNPNVVYDYSLLPHAEHSKNLRAEKSGYVHSFDTVNVGIAAMQLGAGRATKEDKIDHAVGLHIHKKIGDKVEKEDTLATLHYNDASSLNTAYELLKNSIHLAGTVPEAISLIHETLL